MVSLDLPLGLTSPWVVGLVVNSLLAGLAIIIPKKLLTPAGLAHAWGLGVLVWGTLGWRGYVIVMFYFLVGSAVTKVGLEQKQAKGIAEKRDGARGPENVWGSALTGAICALLTVITPEPWLPYLMLAYVASFSTKLSDTTSSEIGKAYGKRTFLVTTFQSVPSGTEGAVSLEGTLAGLGAALLISLLGSGLGLVSGWGVGLCVLAALIANYIESLIGAKWQENYAWLTNEVVNGINTTVGAGLAVCGELVTKAWS
ncbi:TIGR00297 family protein [Synechococcus sp. PCC 6312]|uniref:TIGR00297 family protein n=1 Tax=Synechococcus sp. (strain ATCC 27167 / PCC 6312) TaxID=195253 RepID=UPI00029F1C6A|nr:TIGR00297 family protein [Synechococcus sp. PCC 6312]AFY59350.1 TIGR00297 family protein [Synechococcus sp. PCC 6312]